MTLISLTLVAIVITFSAGALVAYFYTSMDEYNKRMDMLVEINTLRARELPPRVLEVWSHKTDGGARGVYLRSIDADKTVEALALVASGARAFSEAGLQGVLTRRELAALRNELIKAHYAQWASSDRRQGIIWTPEGQALLETCKTEAVRARAYTPTIAKRGILSGVGEGRYA